MNRLRIALIGLLVGLGVAACDDAPRLAAAPSPQEPGVEAIGYYCGMAVADHVGPKGQIFLEGRTEPLWFSSVRDTLAFTMLPEEPKTISAMYVNDVGRSRDWARPEAGAWVSAKDALFVAGSAAVGGMGGSEIVPFADRTAAERFRNEHGGEIFRFGEVPAQFVLGAGDRPMAASDTGHGAHGKH